MPLTVGVPTETKNHEHRVAITPDGVRELAILDVPVLVQSGAGQHKNGNQHHGRQQLGGNGQRVAGGQRFPEQDAAVLAVVVQGAEQVEKHHERHDDREERGACP